MGVYRQRQAVQVQVQEVLSKEKEVSVNHDDKITSSQSTVKIKKNGSGLKNALLDKRPYLTPFCNP